MEHSSLDHECAAKLALLADATRLTTMERLLNGPATVSVLCGMLGVEQSLMSHHLHKLRNAGLVKSTRQGKHVLYSLAEAATAASGRDIDLGCCRLQF